ncbi:MAG: spfh domain / band 7 family protein [Collimonas fungivorans]|uniref:SPFH domain-containing protein n=1 Tax=Collimonas fungivorans TaxID=158899 RepID=UPI0026F081F7|nr:SPFH domain-containing protein [Collimonas fungivorans]MDB5768350.1 spfh domain / band 7 family protein [Collimonas fungivorans]
MSERLESLAQGLLALLTTTISAIGATLVGLARAARRAWILLLALALIGGSGYELITHPPFKTLEPGEVGIRANKLTGGTTEVKDGLVVVIPGLHELRRYSLLDQVYRPVRSSKANGEAPFQSIEGLSLGVDLTIRYAIDPARLAAIAEKLPADINGEIVEPMVQGVIYKSFTRYSVRDIFSTKRGEIQKEIESELKPKLAADGIILRGVQMGQVDLPPEYRQGMEKLLAEELESEKMKYTLELKSKQVRQTELEAEADKVKREKSAEAAGNEQIIAAKAQEEAMKHVLPFKQKQIEQRQYEAEAEKVSRIKTAEGSAEARRIEATGEADSRHKLADVEAYRLETIGKVTSAQLERDGALISKNPLLIQKTMADKLSDKISVIIAPPPANGGFIGSALLGGGQTVASQNPQTGATAAQETQQ